MLITNTFDLIILIIGVVGTFLCLLQMYLYDWDLKALMFEEKETK